MASTSETTPEANDELAREEVGPQSDSNPEEAHRKSGSRPRPKSSGAKKPKIVSFTEALADYEKLRVDPHAKLQSKRSAFTRLASAVGTHGRESIELLINRNELDADPAKRLAVAVELSLSDDALIRSSGASAAWTRDVQRWPVYAELAASGLVTARDLLSDDKSRQDRRRWVQAHLETRTNEVLLRTDQSGYWAPGTRENDRLNWLAATSYPSLADVSLPLANELEARRQILELAMVNPTSDQNETKDREAGIGALRQALKTELALLQETSWPDTGAWLLCSRLFTTIGRNKDVWASLSKIRNSLIELGTRSLESPHREKWAQAVAETWYAAPESLEFLEKVASDNLPDLLRAARDAEVRALVDRTRVLIQGRANESPRDASLWSTIDRIPQLSSVDRDWVDQLTHRRRRILGRHPAIEAAEDWEPRRLLTNEFEEVLQAGSAEAALPALSIAHRKVVAFVEAEERKNIEVVVAEFRRVSAGLSESVTEVSRILGATPPFLAESASVAAEAIHGLMSRARELIRETGGLPTPGRTTEDAWSSGSLLEGLRELEFNPSKTIAESRKHRGRMQARLREEAELASAALSEVTTNLLSLPPEAVGLVLEVAIISRSEELLRHVPVVMTAKAWGRQAWDDAVISLAGDNPDPLAVGDEAASATVDRLVAKLKSAQSNRAVDKDLNRLRQEAVAAVEPYWTEQDRAIQGLERVRTETRGLLNGVAPRN